jgi:putative transposase
LRARLVGAVECDGISARAAAARFGVSVSSAIKWVRRHRETGSVAPGRMGGYKPRLLTGDLRDWLLDRTKSDFTLRGLVAELAERDVKVDYVQVWRFVHAEGLDPHSITFAHRDLPEKIAGEERRAARGGSPCKCRDDVRRFSPGDPQGGPILTECGSKLQKKRIARRAATAQGGPATRAVEEVSGTA